MSLSQKVAQAFSHRRASLHLSMAEVTHRSRVMHPAVSEIESGLRYDMKLSTLERLATALGCRIEVRLVDERTGEEIE